MFLAHQAMRDHGVAAVEGAGYGVPAGRFFRLELLMAESSFEARPRPLASACAPGIL